MHKSHIWEKSGSWDMGQNALGQSDYRVFKSTISLEQNDEKAWFFGCWYRFMEIRSWLKNAGVSMVKNGCDHSVLRTLKLAVCQGEMNGKLKVTLAIFRWWWSKMAWPFWSWSSKICCITRINWWNELIFCMLIQI